MISFALLIMIVVSNLAVSFATANTIYIDSPEDWVKFSQDASLDTYFKDKTVILRTNLDFAGLETAQVATFAGIFDGKGHTISGISITDSGSNQGLFRYLQEDAVIKNLSISGKISPAGSKSSVGSLVGNNRGSIEFCHFSGSVKGESNIGGLVGINEATGTISNATAKGSVTGNHFTGGIVGQNLGSIFKSTNLADVNTTISDNTVNVESVNWGEINSTENIRAHTDTGGITGYSSGYIQDCVNKGPVGYTYMGYNVGGVVGRQSGYLNNCQNYHTVLGRKDVGGIVGQIEPHLMLMFSEDTLQKLNKELTILQNILSSSFSHASARSQVLSSGLRDIGETIDQTRDISQLLSKGSLDYLDDVMDTVNITSKRIRYTLEEFIPILDMGKELSQLLNEGLDEIEVGFDHLEITSRKMADALEESQEAMGNLRKAILAGEDALYNTEDALKDLAGAIEGKENINNIIREVETGISGIGYSFGIASQAMIDIANVLKGLDDVDPGFVHMGPQLDEISYALESISQTIMGVGGQVGNIVDKGVSEITGDIKKNIDTILYDFKKVFGRLGLAVKNMEDTFAKLEETSGESGKAFKKFSDGFFKFAGSSEKMTEAVTLTRDLIGTLVLEPNIELPNISAEYRQSGEDLFDSLGNMSTQIKDLHAESTGAKDSVINDMEAASDQVILIFNMLVDSRENKNDSGYIEDISGEGIETAKQGIVYNNQNYGPVSGSSNIGGIAGISQTSIDKSYVLSTLSGKDFVGGIAGHGSNISNAYSLVDITQGAEYIGSIAGKAQGNILNNHYVHANIAAIDGISYSGKASPISYEQLLEIEGLPEAFSQFHLTFIADGNIIKEIPFNYADTFDPSLLPKIPSKDGHDSQWEKFNQGPMVFNQTIEAIYTPLRTVISSDLTRGEDELPLFLAEGRFDKDVQQRYLQPM